MSCSVNALVADWGPGKLFAYPLCGPVGFTVLLLSQCLTEGLKTRQLIYDPTISSFIISQSNMKLLN